MIVRMSFEEGDDGAGLPQLANNSLQRFLTGAAGALGGLGKPLRGQSDEIPGFPEAFA